MDSNYEAGYKVGLLLGSVLGGLLCIGLVVFFIVALVKCFTTKKAGWIVTVVLLTLVGGALVIGSAVKMAGIFREAAAEAKAKSETRRTITSPDGVCTMEVPGHWRTIPELNADATIKVGNPLHEQYCMVIRELREDPAMTLDHFAEVAAGMTHKNANSSDELTLQPIQLGPHPARQCRFDAKLEGLSLTYLHTSVETPDSFCQIICWTMRKDAAAGMPLFEAATASFRAKADPAAGDARVATHDVVPSTDKSLPTAERVRQLVVAQFAVEPEKVAPETTFEALGADELDSVEFVMAIEEDFEVEVPDEDAKTFKSVGDVTAWLEKHAKAAK